MTKTRNSRRRGFLEEYRLDETYLLKPDRASGRPGISEGLAPDGEPVLVKNWPRNSKQNDEDLAEIGVMSCDSSTGSTAIRAPPISLPH
jgi:hypothetical protein